MAFGHRGGRIHGMRGGHYRSRSRSRRRSGRYARPSQPPSTPSNRQSAVAFLKSPEFSNALLGALAGRGGWRGRRPPREEGEGHPGGWSSRGKRRGY